VKKGKEENQLAKLFHKGQKGFTLIELLIVVAILGILAAVIIPNVATFMNTGRLNAARTEAENVKTAALAFYADNGVWPADSDALMGGTEDYLNAAPNGFYDFDDTAAGNNDGRILGTTSTYTVGTTLTWNYGTQTWDK
jgi:type IV pilus assembly protein PilA